MAERRRALLAGLLFSVFMTLAFPPFGWWGFALIAISPLVWCAAATKKPWRAALFAGLGSAPFWAFEHRWLIDVTLAGWPAIVVYLSLYPGLFVWIMGRLRRRCGWWAQPGVWFIAAPLVWSGLETLRGEVVFHGYPWFYVGHPTLDTPGWAELGTLVGASGVSMLTALVASLFCWTIHRHRRYSIGAPLAVFVGGSLVGAAASILALTAYPTPTVVVALIQTNVPQSNKTGWSYEQKKSDFERFLALTSDAASQDPAPDLIVWPETMFPGITLDADAIRIEREARLRFQDGTPTTDFYDDLLALQSRIGIPILVGALGVDGLRINIDDATGEVAIEHDALSNSVFLINSGAVTAQRYDKIHLTPFGEVMPYISASDWLESKLLAFGAPGMSFELDAGFDPVVFGVPVSVHTNAIGPAPPGDTSKFDRTSPLRIVTPICFEATDPGVMRRLVMSPDGSRRADLIVQVSNDGWFGDWLGPREQHLQLCGWRSLELNTAFVRSVNTGISAVEGMHWNGSRWNDESRNQSRADAWVDGVLSADIVLQPKTTVFARVGYLFPWTTLAFTALVLIVPMLPPGARRDPSDVVADDAAPTKGTPHADVDPSADP